MRMRSGNAPGPVARLLWAAALAVLGFAGCAPQRMAGFDAGLMDAARGPCASDLECSNGIFCDGPERCLEGVCMAAVPPCDDRAECTQDACDEAAQQCFHTPDDSRCGDWNACNGIERCLPMASDADPATGCTPVHRDRVM